MAKLPEPTGPYAIGTLTRHLVDQERRERFGGPGAGRRELMVQAWYPARADAQGPFAPYVDDVHTLEALARLMGLPPTAFADTAGIRTHAVRDAAVADDQPAYPVLLYSHGRCGARGNNTAQAEALASHGYVVVAIDHPYVASGVRFPDGRLVEFDTRLLPPWTGRPVGAGPDAGFLDGVVPFLVDDVRFVLRQIAAWSADPGDVLGGRLDLDRIGIFGPSLGGVVAAEACVREPGLGAALIIDVYVPRDVVAAGLRQPVMWISRDAGTMRREGWDEAEIADTHASMRAAFQGLPGDGYIVLVPGMYHVDFSDGRLLSPLIPVRGISGPIDGRRALDLVGAYSVAFFDRHLKGLPAALLDERPGPAADRSFERRRAAISPSRA